jgi:catechol 2,3-dioxygenase-like lactoylglutathione lyase family enzyme
MSEARSPLWNIQPATRLDRRDPYLLLQQVTLFVRDQERSRRFFVDCLGFSVALDYHSPEFGRWVMVAPPDGTARIALVVPKADSEEHALLGKTRQLVFLTENVEAKYREWKERGVKFDCPPEIAPFGSVVANFEDVDGNRFAMIEFDQASRLVEEQRRQSEERLESERRRAQELEIARQVQARLFPQTTPALGTLEYAGACLQARHVGGDYYDFLELGEGRLGFVVGDIAGKGIAAALLMANLQASLRSQCAIAADQPERFLRSVNQQFARILRTETTPRFSSLSMTTRRGGCAMQTAGISPHFCCDATVVWNGWFPRRQYWGYSGIACWRSGSCSLEICWCSIPTA